jgi:hypothetical protein
MKIVVRLVTKRSRERDADRQAAIAAYTLQKIKDETARDRRLLALIWELHDAGQLPAELDSLLLGEWEQYR